MPFRLVATLVPTGFESVTIRLNAHPRTRWTFSWGWRASPPLGGPRVPPARRRDKIPPQITVGPRLKNEVPAMKSPLHRRVRTSRSSVAAANAIAFAFLLFRAEPAVFAQ